MDVRSFRMMLGWSREELMRRSGVSMASVYLIERMGTAGPEDDALVARALLRGQKNRSSKPISVGVDTVLAHANDDPVAVIALDQRGPAYRDGLRP